MTGAVLKVALAAAATAAAASGSAAHAPSSGTAGLFGGPAAVRISHTGRIEIDLEPATTIGLRHIPCAGASNRTTACFVAGHARTRFGRMNTNRRSGR
jgi:hypothetical protein